MPASQFQAVEIGSKGGSMRALNLRCWWPSMRPPAGNLIDLRCVSLNPNLKPRARAAGEPAFGTGNEATGGLRFVRVSHGRSPRGLIVAPALCMRAGRDPSCPV